MALQHIQGRAWYLAGANNLGVVVLEDGGTIVIDTGIDKDAGRLLHRALEAQNLHIQAIINTHHHADHVGGNAYLLRRYPKAQVYAPPFESALIVHPLLEPMYLYGGASPPKALRNRWVLADGSPVHVELGDLTTILSGHTWTAKVAGTALAIIGLPGHSPAQIGVLVDGVCFAADGFFGSAVLHKYGIPYAHDVAAQHSALKTLAAVDAECFLPGHGNLVTRAELDPILDANRTAIETAGRLIHALLAEPADMSTLYLRVMQQLGYTPASLPHYAVFSGAIAAHLSFLEHQHLIELTLRDGVPYWQAC
jgi:glyoxylase-like metal-dependent hydrolase (beta-lactamase superfamily II)